MIQYGRFVTNDTYIKLPYGPAPTRILNIINEIESLFDDEIEYITEYMDIDTHNSHRTMTSKKEPDLMELSKSEIIICDDIIDKYGHLPAMDLVHKSHEEYAYIHTEELGNISVKDMIHDLPDDEKDELIEYLKEQYFANQYLYGLI